MRKTLLKDSLIYTFSSFLAKGIGFILLPFYTRVFSPSDYGVMDMIAISIVLINNVISLQLNQSLSRYYVDTTSKMRKKSIFSTVILYYFLFFTFVASLIIYFRTEISYSLFTTSEYASIISIAAINILLGSIYYIASLMYRLNFETKKFALLSVVEITIVSLCSITLVLFFDTGIIGIFIGQMIGYVILILITFSKVLTNFRFRLTSTKTLKKLILFGAPLVPTVLVLLVMQYIDRFMISSMIGLDALGIYAVALKFASVIALLLSGFQLAWGPHIYKNYQKPETRKLIADYFYVLFFLSLTIVLFLSLFSSMIVSLLVPSTYNKAADIIPVLTLSMVFFSLGSYFAIGFGIKEKNIYQTYIYAVAIVINIVLNLILIKAFSLMGAAVATLISFFIAGVLNLYFSNKLYKIEFHIIKIYMMTLVFISLNIVYFEYREINSLIKISIFIVWLLFVISVEKKHIHNFLNSLRK